MVKKEYGLIKKAIDATHEFEKLMDSIDFNSYIENDENEIKTNDPGYGFYNEYLNNIKKAEDVCKKFTNQKNNSSNQQKQKNTLSTESLIRNLFKAKKTRLEARQQSERKTEERLYNDAIHCMQQSFSDLKVSLKGKSLIKDYNWAKVLYYNELAIGYSGLVKSSMSLGYAEQSISLLEKLYPKLKNIENWDDQKWSNFKSKIEKKEKYLSDSQIIKLYTFALYNKGEAERLLHNDDSAMRTFRRITEIYEAWNDKSSEDNCSDYHAASLRKALILTDMGRGKEALKALKNVNVKWNNFQYVDRESEQASVYIDQKEYREAYKILKVFIDDNNRWRYTFAQRKAKVILLRLLNEYKKNRPEDFKKTVKLTKFDKWSKIENNFSGIYYDKKNEKLTITLELEKKQKKDLISLNKGHKKVVDKIKELWKDLHPDKEDSQEMKKIKEMYPQFKKTAKEILFDATKRKDGDNFKKTCTNLSEYYRYRDTKKDMEKARNCFYFYLFEGSRKGISGISNEEISGWLETESLDDLLKKYSQKIDFKKNLDRVDDEKYLQEFFDSYVDDEDLKKIDMKQKKIVEKIKERLIEIYYQKDNAVDLEKVEEKYEYFVARVENSNNKNSNGADGNKSAPYFIENYFFKQYGNECMWPDSIVERMERNSGEFVKKIVGQSKIYDGRKGILCVLRRWNSFTPALSSSVNPSKGGGYFLYFSHNKESYGIVIDPGYDFLENFFSQGFKIRDIDVILVSHAHPDHTDNLPSILSLFHEMNGRLGKYYYEGKEKNKKTLTLVLSPGVFEHYNRILKPSEEALKDIVVVHVRENNMVKAHELKSHDGKLSIKIEAFGTSHKDLSKSQSLGFKISVKNNNNSTSIGYTGDAKWKGHGSGKWPEHLKGCSIICAHLGSIVNVMKDENFCNTFCKKNDLDECKDKNDCKKLGFKDARVTSANLTKQTQKQHHLYLAGLASYFNYLLDDREIQIAIISEFGEELKDGIRMDLYKKFDAWFAEKKDKAKNKPRCLPGDIGLEIDVFTGDVYCHSCKRFIGRDRIEPVPYGKEEAICFICDECNAVLSTYQIDQKLKDYCENGHTSR